MTVGKRQTLARVVGIYKENVGHHAFFTFLTLKKL